MARPTKYDPETHPVLVKYWARDGFTDAQIATRLGINESTLNRWKHFHPEFCKSIKEEKHTVDYAVEDSLLGRALNGDVTACIFWLKNRKPDRWREKAEIEHSGALEVKNIFAELVKINGHSTGSGASPE